MRSRAFQLSGRLPFTMLIANSQRNRFLMTYYQENIGDSHEMSWPWSSGKSTSHCLRWMPRPRSNFEGVLRIMKTNKVWNLDFDRTL